jgi:3-isopropylmalate/(R)-2-methylmalate dehydratase large subunit
MGSTDIASAMACGEIWMKVPPTIKFVYHGKLSKWVGGKDLILYTIGDIGVDGALYSAMEFGGEAIDALSMDGRFTMANMAIEAGAKAGIFKVDNKTLEYVKARAKRPYKIYDPDEDAGYARIIEYDVSNLEPQVAFPHLPSNTKPISQVGEIDIDQVVIGSCTNGRLEDLQIAAQILKGRKVHKQVRCIVIPGTQQVYLQAMHEGLIEAFITAGAVVSTPTCGPCLGGYMGVLAAGERCVSTTNRNFVGRMGSLQSEVYLANPAVAAASAVSGRISSPDNVTK